jgi:hypothetical protein
MTDQQIQSMLHQHPGNAAVVRTSFSYQRSRNGAWYGSTSRTESPVLVPLEKVLDWVGSEVSVVHFADGTQEHWDLRHTPCRFFTTDPSGKPRLFAKGYYRPEPFAEASA